MSLNRRNIKKDFLVVVVVVVFGKLLGFFREMVVAYFYGASSDTDAFYYVNGLITSIFTIITMGLASAFTPTYLDTYIKEGKDRSDLFANKIVTVLVSLGLIASFTLLLVPNMWLRLLAPDLNTATKVIAVRMLRIMAPCVILYIFFSIQKCILNAHQQYFITEASGIPYSIAICVFTMVLNSSLGSNALPVAAALGVFLQFAFTFFFSRKKYVYKPVRLSFPDPEIKAYFSMLVPIVVAAICEEANGLLRKALAAGMGEGAIANLSYCMTLTTLVNGIIITSISTVYYPHLIKSYSEDNIDLFKNTINSCLSMAAALVIPIVTFLYILSNDVVKIIYERGNFTSKNTREVASIFSIYILGSIMYAFRSIIKTAFYSTKNPKTPAKNELLYLILCMACNVIQVKLFHRGLISLGIAWVLSITLVTPFLYFRFQKDHFRILNRVTVADGIKSVFASIFFGIILIFLNKSMASFNEYLKTVVLFGIALIVYSLCMIVLKNSFALELINSAKNRVQKWRK